MTETIMRHYYWPTLCQDVLAFYQSCAKCVEHKRGRLPNATLNPIQPTAPWHMVSVDMLGEIHPTSSAGNKYVLVFVDHFTKQAEAIPVPDAKAETFAKVFVTDIVCRYGAPTILLSDLGSNFHAAAAKYIVELFGTKKTFGTAYHPNTTGQVENLNKTLIDILRHQVNEDATDWEEKLPYALAAYRSAVHGTTGHPPYFLDHGRDMRLPVDALLRPVEEVPPQHLYARQLIETLQTVWSETKKIMVETKDKQKEQYDRDAEDREIAVGDLVALKTQYTPPGAPAKFYRRFTFPYRVIEIEWPNYRIRPLGDENLLRLKTVHINRLKLFHGVWAHRSTHDSSTEDEEFEEENDWHCKYCQESFNQNLETRDGRVWLGCDYCDQWMHLTCAGLDEEPSEETWFCPECQALDKTDREQVFSVFTNNLGTNPLVIKSHASKISDPNSRASESRELSEINRLDPTT